MEAQSRQVLYIAMSLDGYIATSDDSLDWLFEVEGEGDNGYGEFIKDIDCVILGRRTYDWVVRETRGAFPYMKQKCFVLSRKNEPLEFAECVNEELAAFIKRTRATYRTIWIVGGGELIRGYLELDGIDEYRITVAPVILGKGIKLFSEIDKGIRLSLAAVNRRNQFVELIYRRKENPNEPSPRE